MKIHQYKEMMKYLTRPDVSNIPIPVPQAPAEPQGLSDEEHAAILNERAQAKQNYATGGRVGYAEGSVAKSTKNKLIDDFLKEELKNNKGKITNQSSADLAEKFNNKYPDKEFYFNGELSPVDHKSIHYRISNNPEFKKNIPLIIGRRIDPVYEDKINKALDVYKKLSDEEKRALRTGGVGHTGALDKFMEDNDLFRESSKYGNKMDQKGLDKNLFSRKLKESGIERPKALSLEENSKNQRLRRKEILNEISSTGYEKHIEDFKRNLQKHLGIEKSELSTGKKMFPLDLAHRTDIDQLYALEQKMDPSDLGLDYYKKNREGYKNKEGYKSIEGKLSDLYDEQNKLYKQAKKLDKVPESLSKKIFLNNDEILQTIGESPFKDKLKPITINPVTLEVKKGSVITNDITKQLGMGLVETPMNEIKIGSEEDAIIKLNLAQQVVDEANELGLIKNVKDSRKAANKFVGKLLSTTESNMLSSFPAQFGESGLLGTLTSKAGRVGSEFSDFAGGKGMAVLGAGLNYPDIREMGYGKAESLGLGAIKTLTQDTFNFILDTLPMPSKYSARGAVNEVAKEMEEKGENPYVEGTGPFKVLDVTKFDWNTFAEKHPGFFQFFNKAAKYVSEKLPTKYITENIIEHEIKKDPNAPFKSQYYDLYDPRSDKEKLSSEQENMYKEKIRKELFKQNPDVEEKYNKQSTNPVSTGPFYLGTETAQEFKTGGRVGYAEGSNDELEIPTLSNQETPMTGIYNAKSKRLESLSPYESYSEQEILGNIESKLPHLSIDENRSYEMPQYAPGHIIDKATDVMPNVLTTPKNEDGIISLATGGRASFQTGGSANFLKMLRNISDSLLDIKNSTHMLGSTAKSKGIAKAAEEALTPYQGGANGNKHTTLIEKIEKAKEHLPKEYHGILDEMKSYADKHAYDAVDDMAKALDKVVDPNLKFESLPKNMFPMEDPLNDAFIIMDPERNHMTGRYVHSVRIDPETGRGTRETFDTFDSKTRTFLKKEDWKPVGVESIEKGKEGLN